jgi:outer membrane protein OmpU
MKKSLLATTALAALGAVAVASPASAKFEVSVKGYMEQWFGYSDNSDSAAADSDMFDQISDSEFFIGFSQTLDNGLKIGGEIQVEGQQDGSGEHVDEEYIYVSGSFGRLELGTDNGAPYRMHYGVKSNGIGIDESDVTNWVAGTSGELRSTSRTTGIDNDQNKITYFSPRVNGFQVGATYLPNSDDINGTTPNTAGQETDGSRDDGFGVAANYVTSVADMSIKASVGYMDAGGDDATAGNEEALSAGIQLGFGGFTASLAYGEHEDDSAATLRDVNVFGVSLAYNMGPAGVSLAYIRGEDSDNNSEQDALEVGASYKVGPGVTAKGSIYYADRVTNGNEVADGVGVAAGLALSF